MKRKAKLLGVLLPVLVLLCSCGGGQPAESALEQLSSSRPDSSSSSKSTDYDALAAELDASGAGNAVSKAFLLWCEQYKSGFAAALAGQLADRPYNESMFYELTGCSLKVLADRYSRAAETQDNLHDYGDNGSDTFTLGFTGDINLADGWHNMLRYEKQPNGIYDCLSSDLLEQMNSADILLVNNEFSFSKRGAPLPGKQYTFRADPGKVKILSQMGADIVSLANNHVYDYGRDAFFDTLDTLDNSNIARVGAGRNLSEAMQPQYYLLGGRKIGYVAASRAEKNIMTPGAAADSEGVLRTYDSALFLQAIAEAKQNSDFVVAYVHWGTENTAQLEQAQREQGRAYIDAGADVVVGAHPHCLQGMEYYKGKPIVYSLGNFWFNMDTLDTGLLKLEIDRTGHVRTIFLPCMQTGGVTSLIKDTEEKQRILSYLQRISIGVTFDADGVAAPQR